MAETTSVGGLLSALAVAPTAPVDSSEPEPHAVRSSAADVIRTKGAKSRLPVRVDVCIVGGLVGAEGVQKREGGGARVKAKGEGRTRRRPPKGGARSGS